MRTSLRPVLLLAPLLLLVSSACSTTGGKIALSPLTVIRDVVDAPLVSLTNVFDFWAGKSDPTPVPGVGVGVGKGGVYPSAGINLSYYVFKPVSWIFGGVDWLLGRSFWPNPPWGLSPWRTEEGGWGELYFPSTRELWDDGHEGGVVSDAVIEEDEG